MLDLEDRIRGAPALLEVMLEMDFPISSDPPNTTYAWDFYQEFLANSPRRLIRIVCADYHDPEGAESGDGKELDAFEAEYRPLFEATVAATEAQWGSATQLGAPSYRQRAREWGAGEKLGSIDQTDHVRFDDDLFNFDRGELAYWVRNDRIALIHFASHSGDGDFQISLCVCVVPKDR